MIKICSLDFLNREVFDTDVMLEDGKVVVKSGSKVTPALLLKLYFQDIYTQQDLCEIDKNEALFNQQEKIRIQQEEKELLQKTLEEKQLKKESEEKIPHEFTPVEQAAEERKKYGQIESQEEKEKESSPLLVFDEERAARIAKYAVMLGKSINMEQGNLNELEKAAFYHDIGRKKLREEDLGKKDFKRKVANLSYDIMTKEMNLPEQVAEVAHFYLDSYESKDFKLDKQHGFVVPYSHIISIVVCYDNLLAEFSKDETLLKMLQMGGNRFNIFVLHRFINIMRNSNG